MNGGRKIQLISDNLRRTKTLPLFDHLFNQTLWFQNAIVPHGPEYHTPF